MRALLTAALIAAGALGGPGGQPQSHGDHTSVRNVGAGLVIATGNFPGTPAVATATAYALVQTIVVLVLALAWGRWAVHRGTAVGGSSEVLTSPK